MKGLRELRAAELVTARRSSINPEVFDFRRLRNVYRLQPERLDDPAQMPATIPPLDTASIIAARELDSLIRERVRSDHDGSGH